MTTLNNRLLSVVLALVVLGFITNAQAQVRRPAGAGMQAAGLADAIRSTAVGHNALHFNPAGMSQVLAYQVTTGFGYGHSDRQVMPTISFVDSLLNPMVALGIGYTFRTSTGFPDTELVDGNELRRNEHHTRLAVSSGYRGDSLSIFVGTGINWLNMEEKGIGSKEDYWTMDPGILVIIARSVRLSVVGHNVVGFTDKDPKGDLPARLGTGISFALQNVLLAFDTVTDFETYPDRAYATYNMGAQYAILSKIPVRAGFQIDTGQETQRVGGGFGYWTPSFMVDAGYFQNVNASGDFILGLDLVFSLN